MSSSEAVSVGMDLGSSCSAICTSDGSIRSLRSVVGWPADGDADKFSAADAVVGEAALERRSLLDLCWPLADGLETASEGRAARALHQLLVELLRADPRAEMGPPVHAVVGLPSGTVEGEIARLRQCFSGLVDSLLLVSAPLALAYGIDALESALIIDIGARSSDLVLMLGRYPTIDDRHTLPSGGNAIDAALQQEVTQKYPDLNVSLETAQRWKERHGFVGVRAQRIVVAEPCGDQPRTLDITDQLRLSCEGLLDPLADAMLQVLEECPLEKQSAVLRNIILTGGSSQIRGLASQLEAVLRDRGGRVRRIKDPTFVAPLGGLSLAADLSEQDWQQLSIN